MTKCHKALSKFMYTYLFIRDKHIEINVALRSNGVYLKASAEIPITWQKAEKVTEVGITVLND